MSLSDRIRPNSEAAPWVIVEVQKMEKRIAELLVKLAFERVTIAEQRLRIAELEELAELRLRVAQANSEGGAK